jgi:hypothetical protein
MKISRAKAHTTMMVMQLSMPNELKSILKTMLENGGFISRSSYTSESTPVTDTPLDVIDRSAISPVTDTPLDVIDRSAISPVTDTPLDVIDRSAISPVTDTPLDVIDRSAISPVTDAPLDVIDRSAISPVTDTPLDVIDRSAISPVTDAPLDVIDRSAISPVTDTPLDVIDRSAISPVTDAPLDVIDRSAISPVTDTPLDVIDGSAISPVFLEQNILVIGWYNRKNLGDDCFVLAFNKLFPNCTVCCSDDVKEIPSDVDVVICGGGDIINKYFMLKIKPLLQNFKGTCYAISVGIPFPDDAELLKSFDHAFVRSPADYDAAIQITPKENVTVIPDISWMLPAVSAATSLPFDMPVRQRVGICLTQPAFANNPCYESLMANTVSFISKLAEKYEIHLLPFNYGDHPNESDVILNDIIASQVVQGIVDVTDTSVNTHDGMMSYIDRMDYMICMRYHSVQFTLKAKKPFIAMYTTRKINNLIEQLGFQDYAYRLPVDDKYRPNDINVDTVITLFEKCVNSPNILESGFVVDTDYIKNTISSNIKRTVYFHPNADTCEQAILRTKGYLHRLLSPVDNKSIDAWFYGDSNAPTIQNIQGNISIDSIAHTMCFALTRHISTPYVWGMTENITKSDFNIFESAKWVFEDRQNSNESIVVNPLKMQITTCIDINYFLQDDFKAYHRSGWSYCIGGLLHFDAKILDRTPIAKLDTYVDRTFHWGYETLCSADIVPYRDPWMGFIHHTFEQEHGSHNCVQLFNNPGFIESLKHCKCLFVLSKYLQAQLRDALDIAGFAEVRVEVLYHPMELVDNNFTVEKFMSNDDRKIINIGAWLRNPYAIFELPLQEHWHNPLSLRKAILKGKDMNSVMEPDWLMGYVNGLQYADPVHGPNGNGICRPCGDGEEIFICRPEGDICRPEGDIYRHDCATNMHVAGMVTMLHRQHDSISVLSQLTNEEYDNLLTCNIVFLNLIDASAVNTVMECIVRNTVLIVNRHPALEEVLGADYPGFYENLSEAADILADIKNIYSIYEHLVNIPKEQFTLDVFLTRFQDIVNSL